MQNLKVPERPEDLPGFIDGIKTQLDETYVALIQGRRAFQDMCVMWASMVHTRYHGFEKTWQQCEDEFCMSVFTVYSELSKIAKKQGEP